MPTRLPAPTGDQIGRARAIRGWSQKDLAAALNVTERTVQRYEAGGAPAHRPFVVGRLVQILPALEQIVAEDAELAEAS